jgi:hypothetical protein
MKTEDMRIDCLSDINASGAAVRRADDAVCANAAAAAREARQP